MARAYTVQRQPGRVRLPGRNDTRPMSLPPQPTQQTVKATLVGVTTGPGTTITMVPADLTQEGRVDISEFTIISLDAGVY